MSTLTVTAVSKYDWRDERIKYSTCDGFIRPLVERARHHAWDASYAEVVPGSEVSSTKVAVIMSSLRNFRSVWVGGALWALSQRRDAILLCNDSRFPDLVKDAQELLKRPEFLLKDASWTKARSAEINAHWPSLKLVLEELASGCWGWQTVVGSLGKADAASFKMHPDTNMTGVDPTAYWQPMYEQWLTEVRVEEKLRRWLHMTLIKSTRGLDLRQRGWKVVLIGMEPPATLLASAPDTVVLPPMAEEWLVKLMANAWGVTAFGYKHAGSLWWRPRYLISALAGNVLQAIPEEAVKLGPSFVEASNWRGVEIVSDRELRELAAAQQLEYFALTAPREVFDGQLDALLGTSATAGELALNTFGSIVPSQEANVNSEIL